MKYWAVYKHNTVTQNFDLMISHLEEDEEELLDAIADEIKRMGQLYSVEIHEKTPPETIPFFESSFHKDNPEYKNPS